MTNEKRTKNFSSIFRWILFIVSTCSLLYLMYLGEVSNSKIKEYSKADFENRQASRAVAQIRSHLAFAGWNCTEYVNNKNEKFLDECYNALDASFAQISGRIRSDSSELENELNKIYSIVDKLSLEKDNKKQIQYLNDLYQNSKKLFINLGFLESKYWVITSENFAEHSTSIIQRSKISTFVILAVFSVMIFLIYLLVKKDRDDKKLKLFNEQLENQRVQLIHSGKMSTLGEMASGVAHEINNPLAIIDGKAQQLKKMIQRNESQTDQLLIHVEKILKMTERISKIVKGLRSFARDGEKDPFEYKKIDEIIHDTLELCEAKLKNNNVHFDYKIYDESAEIWCRPTQISQVILNLIHNAYDAIQNFEEKWIRIQIRNLGESIEISVTDSGKGIPLDVQYKIFQPFFTTKDAGKGTGLGLSISNNIIQEHKGSLQINSNSPNTEFIIQLPKKQS